MSKSYTARQLAQIDSFLTTHTIKTKTLGVTPNLQSCSDLTFTNWELEDQYQPVSGKYIGVWANNNVTRWQLSKQYGFTYIVVGLGQSTDTSYTNNFSLGNFMLNVPYNATQQTLQNEPIYNYYLIDEPFKNVSYIVVNHIDSLIYNRSSSAKLLFTDYYWPPQNYDPTCFGVSGNETYIKDYYFILPNLYIMCDQYSGNNCGSTHDFWNEYKADYGTPFRNISNFISLADLSYVGDLLNLATPWGMNPIWIYGADSNMNQGFYQQYAISAWETGWLLRQERQINVEWICTSPNPCVNCVYPTQGNWEPGNVWYGSLSQYISY